MMLASVLEAVERGLQRADPDSYRRLVGRLRAELTVAEPDDALRRLLAASPAVAEIYENLHYEHAGLCLRPVDAAAHAEKAATALIERVRART